MARTSEFNKILQNVVGHVQPDAFPVALAAAIRSVSDSDNGLDLPAPVDAPFDMSLIPQRVHIH